MIKTCAFSILILFAKISMAQDAMIPVDSVLNYIGQTVTVYGKVMDARYLEASKSKPTLINVGDRYPYQKMTVVIYGDKRANFNYQPEAFLLDKVIYVKGQVDLYRKTPQIRVTSPSQISLTPPVDLVPSGAAINTTEKKTKQIPVTAPKLDVHLSTKASSDNTISKENVSLPEQKKIESDLHTNVVLRAPVKLKDGPGNRYFTLGSLKKGTTIEVLAFYYRWARVVATKDNKPLVGYVKTKDLNNGH
jgi:DNA/RNA endonuclease YhcR with UshA esterase domain